MLAVLMVFATPVAADNVIYFDPDPSCATPGEVITVTMWVDADNGSAAFQDDIYFDPAVVNITSGTAGDYPALFGFVHHGNWVRVAGLTMNGLDHDPGLWKLADFTLVANNSGTGTLQHTANGLYNQYGYNLPNQVWNDGTFNCPCAVPYTIISCNSSGSEKNEFAPNETVYAKGIGLSAYTDYMLWIQGDPVGEGNTLNTSKDPSPSQEIVTTDVDGDFGHTAIWSIPSDAIPTHHHYDIVADKQDDGANTGKYNAASDGIDSAIMVVGFVAPVPAAAQPPALFLIDGWVSDSSGDPVNDPVVVITNTNTGVSWDAKNDSASNYYELILNSDDVSANDNLQIEASGCSQSKTVDHTMTQGEIGDGGFSQDITFGSAAEQNLIVESITPNCGGYLFGNESNEISAVIKNAGSGNAGASHASFMLSDGYTETVSVGVLASGANETVIITNPTIRNAGDAVTITVTADCNSEIGESDETNNVLTLDTTVVNNGYKGKRYTGGEDINTMATYDLNGNLVYSVGDSYYLSSYSYPDWTAYNASWTAGDLPVTGTVREARLCVPYTWDKKGVMPTYASLNFNGVTQTLDEHYNDEKGWGTSYPYGMLVYDVTADFDASGNVANLTNSCLDGGGTSMRGMLLVVIYKDATEPRRLIYMGEEFDMLYGGSGKCTTPEEATAWAPITGPTIELAMVVDATLITIAPGAGPTEGELLFNGQVWNDVWSFAGTNGAQIGIDERDVAAYLEPTDNLVGFQSSEDYMEASNTFLVVEYGSEEVPISCELSGIGRRPGHLNSGNDLTLTARVKNTGESLVYCQMEWQIKDGSGTVVETILGDVFTEEAGNGPGKTSKPWTVDLDPGSYTVAGILYYGATADNLDCTDGPVDGGTFTVV